MLQKLSETNQCFQIVTSKHKHVIHLLSEDEQNITAFMQKTSGYSP